MTISFQAMSLPQGFHQLDPQVNAGWDLRAVITTRGQGECVQHWHRSGRTLEDMIATPVSSPRVC